MELVVYGVELMLLAELTVPDLTHCLRACLKQHTLFAGIRTVTWVPPRCARGPMNPCARVQQSARVCRTGLGVARKTGSVSGVEES